MKEGFYEGEGRRLVQYYVRMTAQDQVSTSSITYGSSNKVNFFFNEIQAENYWGDLGLC